MTADDFEHDVPVSQYGQARREAWLAHHQANADMAEPAELAAHAPDSAYLRRSQQGIMRMSGEEQAALRAAQAATTGTGTDSPRTLTYLGGTDWESQGAGAVGPAPARVYASQIGQQQADMMSPLARFMNGQQ